MSSNYEETKPKNNQNQFILNHFVHLKEMKNTRLDT
jgi:hypothetical protein